MDSYITVNVKTGASSQYVFRRPSITTTHPMITVLTGPNTEDARLTEYCFFEGKGATAIQRLMERVEELEKFVDDLVALSVTDSRDGSLVQFLERTDADEPDLEEAYDRVAEVIEERHGQNSDHTDVVAEGHWVRDED